MQHTIWRVFQVVITVAAVSGLVLAQTGTSSIGTVSTNSSYTGGVYGAALGNSVYGRTYGSGSSTTNVFGSSFGSYQGKASVLVIKFK